MTDRDIQLLWLYVGEIWSTFVIPDNPDLRNMRMQAWHDTLGDLDQKAVRAAFANLARDQYTPPLGKIRDTAQELARRQLGEQPTPDVDQAWSAVYEHACGRPVDQSILNHPATKAATRAIGWDHIRYSENISVERAHFLRIYATISERVGQEQLRPAPAVLAFINDQPVAIKRPEDARAIDVAT